MDNQQQQAADRVREANNILVTVSNNPSVDQLAACIGLTLSLNKMGKHATAVFSGVVPSTLEFLQPEKTIERNTDSLRDFIISLDKAKADKLRYKVEDTVVKIFITPYRTSIGEHDLEFSQGDFNVDVVLALGVHSQAELDQAITSHGRILHDATVVTLNVKPGGELGSINWLDPTASSLSELSVQLIDILDKNLMDGQIATAMLTGIVAETERFSNGKTSPRTMTISAELMNAGANQQLVAAKLEEPVAPPVVASTPIAEAAHDHEAPVAPVQKVDDGTLEITHEANAASTEHEADPQAAEPQPEDTTPAAEPQTPASEPEAPAQSHQLLQHTNEAAVEPHVPESTTPILPEPVANQADDDAFAVIGSQQPETPAPMAVFEPEAADPAPPQIHIDEHGSLSPMDSLPPVSTELPSISHHDSAPKMITEPPTMGGHLTANTTPDSYDSATGFGMPAHEEAPGEPPSSELPYTSPTIQPPADDPAHAAAAPFLLGDAPGGTTVSQPDTEPSHLPTIQPGDTLSDIEKSVNSSHLSTQPSFAQSPTVAPPVTPAYAPPAPAYQPPAFQPPAQPQPAWAPPASADPYAVPNLPVAAPAPAYPPAPAFAPVAPQQPAYPEPQAAAADVAADDQPQAGDVQSARDAVMQAINAVPADNLPPVAAQPLPSVRPEPTPYQQPAAPAPQAPVEPPTPVDPTAPPPVPPPMTPYNQPY